MTRLAYVMSRFPLLSETFILRELDQLDAMGWEIELYPLLVEVEGVRHDEVGAWLRRIRWVPFVGSITAAANVRMFRDAPRRYLGTLARALGGNLSSPEFLPRALAVFPKAVAVAEKMRETGVSHVHAHYATHPALLAWVVHQLTGIPYSVTVHAHDLYVDQAMLRRKLLDARFVVTVSDYNRERIGRDVDAEVQAKTHVVRCGIDPAGYATEDGKGTRGPSSAHVVSVGSLQPYKGHVHLIDAMAILRRSDVNYRLTIVGEGRERPRLERRIEELDLEACVRLAGAQTQAQVATLLRSADVYVQPSVVERSGKMEGIPVALMEAMASCVPVVATRISGVPELVRAGETGALVEPEDPHALADAIDGLARDRDLSRRLTVAARQLVEAEYDVRKNAERLSGLFRAKLEPDAVPRPAYRVASPHGDPGADPAIGSAAGGRGA